MNNNNFLYLPPFYFDKNKKVQLRVKVGDDIIMVSILQKRYYP